MKNGEIGKDNWSHARWCSEHKQYHGILCDCEFYPKKIRDEIANDAKEWKKNLQDPKWIDEQRKNGVPEKVIAIQQVFAGTN